jgi:hypothetical protein
VLVQEIEANRLERAIASDLAEAEAAYTQAFHACENGPEEGPGEDPAIVSRCLLYSADTDDPAEAEVMTTDGRARCLRVFTDEYPG